MRLFFGPRGRRKKSDARHARAQLPSQKVEGRDANLPLVVLYAAAPNLGFALQHPRVHSLSRMHLPPPEVNVG